MYTFLIVMLNHCPHPNHFVHVINIDTYLISTVFNLNVPYSNLQIKQCNQPKLSNLNFYRLRCDEHDAEASTPNSTEEAASQHNSVDTDNDNGKCLACLVCLHYLFLFLLLVASAEEVVKEKQV